MTALETVRGRDVQVGDEIEVIGTIRRVTGMRPYQHPIVCPEGDARIATWPAPTDPTRDSGMTIFDTDLIRRVPR